MVLETLREYCVFCINVLKSLEICLSRYYNLAMMFGGEHLLISKRCTPFLPLPKQTASQWKTGMQGPWPDLSIPLVSMCSELSVVNRRSATQLYPGCMPVKRREEEIGRNHWRFIRGAPRTLSPGLGQELGVGLTPTPRWRSLKGSWSAIGRG